MQEEENNTNDQDITEENKQQIITKRDMQAKRVFEIMQVKCEAEEESGDEGNAEPSDASHMWSKVNRRALQEWDDMLHVLNYG